MGEKFGGSNVEKRPELGPKIPERQPVDRFGELKRLFLTEGGRQLVSADIAGMEKMFEEVMEERGFSFEVFDPTESGGGPNYKIQREKLTRASNEETVASLEGWGEKLFEAVGRNTHDKSTGEKGIVVAQVVLDLYRFAAKLRTQKEPNTDHQRAEETTKKLNMRIANWHSIEGGIKNPSGCSGEIMARVVDWLLTGETSLPETAA